MVTGILITLLLLIILLAIPVTLRFQVSWQKQFQSTITLFWLFGLVRVRMPISPGKSVSGPEKNQTKKKSKRAKSSSGKKAIQFSVIRQNKFRRRISRFIRDVWHAVQKQDITLHILIGLGDPADTGKLWGVIGPVTGVLANSREVMIEIEPEFMEALFELDGRGSIRVIPLQLLYLVIGLLLSPVVWRGINQMRTVGR